jgi:beta-1,4-mannosyltransferase
VSYNPYIDDTIASLEKYYRVINNENPSDKGIFDLLKYIFKIDYLFLNWIENLPERKAGRIQTRFFLAILPILKLLGVKIVWTMHNKLSHSEDHLFLKKLIFKGLLNNADIILTHSSEGVAYGENIKKGCGPRIHYFPHPVKDRRNKINTDKQFDILIWGTLSPYKGILEFLRLLFEKNYLNKYKILIIGKSTSQNYFNLLLQYSNDNINIKDDFIDDAVLKELISQSDIVLFTYAKSSILSSGALMDSIGFGGNVVGPDVGAFADLAKEGIINTYRESDDMFMIIDAVIAKKDNFGNSSIDQFLQANSWNKFAENIHQLLK